LYDCFINPRLSNINIVNECIKNNFEYFLDKNKLYFNNSKLQHKNYNIHIVHKNPLDNLNDYEYYIRCVDRFKNLKNNILFVGGNENDNIKSTTDKIKIMLFLILHEKPQRRRS
jgi:hypothetical protein